MSEQETKPEVDQAAESWTWLVEAATAVLLLIGTAVALHYYAAPSNNDELLSQVHDLNQQVQQLKQEQAMPVMVLNRYRNSICYVFGVYQVGFANQPPRLRARVSGTGFVVAKGLLATNRHVAEPWYGDSEADALIQRGATPKLEKLVAFFPGAPEPFDSRVVAQRSGCAAHGFHPCDTRVGTFAAGDESHASGRAGDGHRVSDGCGRNGGEVADRGLRTAGLPA